MDLKEYFLSKKIGVLCGGRSSEREISLRSGKKVLESLQRQGFNVCEIDPISGDFFERLKTIDVAFIALHGRYGEDGAVQGLLELIKIPYTGSKVLASALAMNKVAAKQIFQIQGIPTPEYVILPLTNGRTYEDVIDNLGLPLVVKPVSEGSSIGVSILRDKDEIKHTVNNLLRTYNDGFIEKYISGMSVTVGILGWDDNIRALPILELVPKKEFYDYEAKYTAGMTEFVIPARLDKDVYKHVQQVAIKAHTSLGCYGFSRVDIIVDDKGVPYVHDVNTIPGLTDVSDLPACAAADGMSYDELIFEMLCSAYAGD